MRIARTNFYEKYAWVRSFLWISFIIFHAILPFNLKIKKAPSNQKKIAWDE
jgi:hypothetical protein